MLSVFNLNPKKEDKTPAKVDWKPAALESQGAPKRARASSTSGETSEPSPSVKAVKHCHSDITGRRMEKLLR